ncbi:MAG: AMP-binding protein [Bacteriovoracaceae bacterium]
MKILNDYLQEAASTEQIVQFYSLKKIERFTYNDIFKNCQKTAATLQKLGIKKGDRVAIMLPTEVNFYYAFFGALLIGAIPAALYPPVSLGQFTEWKQRTQICLDSINTKIILTNNLMIGVVNQLKTATGALTIEDSLKSDSILSTQMINEEDLAFIQFSSGSTGIPKPVALTHKAVVTNALTILESLPSDHNNKAVSWLPLYHDMGLIGCLIATMMSKGELTLIRPEQFLTNPILWFKALTETKANFSVAPNFAFGLCEKKISLNDCYELKIDLSHWKNVLCGAEPVSYKTLKDFSDKFKAIGFKFNAITPVYGLSEGSLAVSFAKIGEEPKILYFDEYELQINGKAQIASNKTLGIGLVSLGHPLNEVFLEVRNLDNQKVQDQEVGILWIKGPSLLKEYFQMSEATNAVLKNGWFNTGDRAFIFEGNLYICGRYKDIIIKNGKNIDPTSIEEVVNKVPFIRAGRSVAFSYVNNSTQLEEIVLTVEVDKSKLNEINASDAKEVIKQTVLKNINIVIDEVVLLSKGETPRTSSGKIKRFDTKMQFINKKLANNKNVPNKFKLIAENYLFKIKYRCQKAIQNIIRF